MGWWSDIFVSPGKRAASRTAVESGMNRGDTAIYLQSTDGNQVRTTEAEKMVQRVDSTSNVFQRTLRRFSTNAGEKSRLRSIAWTAVLGVLLLFIGFVAFVVGMSIGRRYMGKVDNVINTELAYQDMQSILYAISVCFSAVFAVLAIASVQTLFSQEKKLDVYRYGARNTLKTSKGGLWSSKRMKIYIMVMNVMYIVSACYFVLQIVATWSLVLWYRDLNSITEPALTPEEEVDQIFEKTSATSNVTKETVDDYLGNITREFEIFFDQTPLGNLTAAEILCPGLFCVNLDALSFVTSDECICNATTIEAVNGWSAQAHMYFIIALVGACLLFVSILILGMRSMLAGSKVKVRVSQWELVAPMLVPHDAAGPRPSRHSSWDLHVDHPREQRVHSNQPKASLYLETPAGIMVDTGDSVPFDIETYFPTVDLHDIEQGEHSDLSVYSCADSDDLNKRLDVTRASSRKRSVQFDGACSSKMPNSGTQVTSVVEAISTTSHPIKVEQEHGDASSATKVGKPVQKDRISDESFISTRPRVLFSMEPDPREKRSRVVSAYNVNGSIQKQDTVSLVLDRLSSGAGSSSKRSTSQHTSESQASDNCDANPFLYRH